MNLISIYERVPVSSILIHTQLTLPFYIYDYIQELTVKGLEQEISKITCNHQKEINELKRHHQQEILNAVDEARQKHESLEMNIRENYAQDREVAIEKERNAIRERYGK